MLEYLKSDLYCYEGKTSFGSFVKYYRKSAGFRFLVAFRLINEKGFWKIIGVILWMLRNKQLIQIQRKTKIGYGLYIGHGGPIVVNPTTIIGDNCNLSQFTTIGANDEQAAVIGDNVYIAPNCCLVENVIIGNNVTIGAGSVVTKNIPENATAVGNYAKVINYNNPGRYIKNAWECER